VLRQNMEVTATNKLLFRRSCGLAIEKRKKAQKQYSFLKKIYFHLHIYIMLNIVFVCEMFLFYAFNIFCINFY